MRNETTHKGSKMKARIASSKMIGNGQVKVAWSDGIEFVYDAALKLTTAGLYDTQREAVSRTSAELTLNGVGC